MPPTNDSQKSAGDRAYWLAWLQVERAGPVSLKRLHEHFGSLAAAWQAPPAQICAVAGVGPVVAENLVAARSRLDPAALLADYAARNPQFWTPADAEYPRLLAEIPSPPPLLHYRGAIDPAESSGTTPTIAIVGTRRPSSYGRRWARRLATALVQNGFTVISGMAAGIDGEAHRSALAAGGRTIAVLGTGVDVVYPSHHEELYREIQARGAIFSEYPAGTAPSRTSFPARNRIIAGLARATIVVEAPTRSGALITARHANEFGRDVYVVPGCLDEEAAMGCLGLLSCGAHAILGEGHLLELLGTMPQLDLPLDLPSSEPEVPSSGLDTGLDAGLNTELADILAAISPTETSFEQITTRARMPAGQVSAAIVQLELLGLVTQLPGARYRRN